LGRCSWNCDFSEPTVHAFDDPTLRRSQFGNLLPGHILVLLGSKPIVYPMYQIEIENWCANQRAKSFDKTALATVGCEWSR
jgi:hypothetical protein